ncbi:hypothetical protein [Maribellus mangrovi]|uniref:hypothetical protein n=1 Tax=Maribellus mangrovi TaxID=3133146 RepID=UPI0030ED5456
MSKFVKIIPILIVVGILFFILKPKSSNIESTESQSNISNNNVEVKVDSSQLQIASLITRFNCDTTSLGDIMDFTYKASEQMSKDDTRLFTVLLTDIFVSQNDSIYVISGSNFDYALFKAGCEFTLQKRLLDLSLKKIDLVYCVVNNPRLVRIRNYEVEVDQFYDENSEISIESAPSFKIKGECIHLERVIHN